MKSYYDLTASRIRGRAERERQQALINRAGGIVSYMQGAKKAPASGSPLPGPLCAKVARIQEEQWRE